MNSRRTSAVDGEAEAPTVARGDVQPHPTTSRPRVRAIMRADPTRSTTARRRCKIGNDRVSGSVADVVNNGTRAFAGAIGGTGGTATGGASTLTLTGANTDSGTTAVSAGAAQAGTAACR